MVRLGSWSSILLVLAVQALVVALLLLRGRENRLAQRYLAALMLVVAGLLMPFILGYAGAYDAWPWLSFAPFAVPLAVGPLLYAYVHALVLGRPIAARHWIAPAIQFGWQAALFPASVETKTRIDALLIEPWVGPLSSAAVLASMALYAWLCWRMLGRYEAWLSERRRQLAPARRLRAGLGLLVLLLAVRAGYQLFEALVRPTDYFDLFFYYLLLGATGIAVGVDGWRNSAAPTPPIAAGEEVDWAERGAAWAEELRRGGWWRDPELDLAGLARRLGTNSSHASRALASEGGFAALIGRVRAEAVAEHIDAGSRADLLTLAMNAGFGSKASFNRAFRARFGITPSAYRMRRVATGESSPLQGN